MVQFKREGDFAMAKTTPVPEVNIDELRDAIRGEYREVAHTPDKGFHFHTGRALTAVVEYRDEWLEGIPEHAVESFAGTGNPFSMGLMQPGERVVDLGCGAGIDSLVAAKQVGEKGAVVGIDMTDEMLAKARDCAGELGWSQVEFRRGFLEEIPVEDGWADVVISNGVINLCPDKAGVFAEIHRVLKPGGRIQAGDILVARSVSESAKQKIDLWTG